MKIILWKGYHEPQFAKLAAQALAGRLLLIACPPEHVDFTFLPALPEGDVELAGDWGGLAAPPRSTFTAHPRQPCLGVFTSATTERARLVLYSRENVQSCATAIFSLFNRERISRVFCYPQPYHTFGLTLGYAATHLFGWELLAPEGRYSRAHHELWAEYAGEGQLTLGTPTHFLDLLEFTANSRLTPRASYSAIVGGARVNRSLWLDLRKRLRIEAPSIGYGATEASPGVCHLAPGVIPECDGVIGQPLSHLEVSVDPLSGVTFRGASVCAAIVHEGRVEFPESITLPDLLRPGENGSWIYEGRSQFTLNRGGKKVLLEAVENELRSRFGLEALGFPVPDSRLGEELGLLLRVPQEELRFRREEFIKHLRARFGMNFSEVHLKAVSGFPLNENLKPDRRAALKQLPVCSSSPSS